MRCSAHCPTAGDGAPPPGPETTGPPASAERLTTEAGLSVGPPPENPVLCRAISASVLPGLPGRIPFFDLAKPRNLAETPRVADFPDAFHERIPRRARCRGSIVESLVSRASRQTSGTRQSACGAGAGTRCRRRAVGQRSVAASPSRASQSRRKRLRSYRSSAAWRALAPWAWASCGSATKARAAFPVCPGWWTAPRRRAVPPRRPRDGERDHRHAQVRRLQERESERGPAGQVDVDAAARELLVHSCL